MSHFAAMACRFSRFQTLLNTLKSMGVSEKEILIHAPTHGTHAGYGTLAKPRPAKSGRWTDGSLQESCSVIVTECGMQQLGRAAGEQGAQAGINRSQRAEIGFRDCGCEENPGLVLDTDPYESGRKFTGWLTATYQLNVAREDGFDATGVEVNEDGGFQILLRRPPQKRRGIGSRIGAMVGRR